VALQLLNLLRMPDPNDPLTDDERVSKRVVYEHVSSSGTSKQTGIVIAVLVVLALIIVGYIFMHMR
jgi:hypothetical protein